MNRSHLRSEHKLEALVSRESSFLIQQHLVHGGVFHGAMGNMVSFVVRISSRNKSYRRPAVLQRVIIPVALLLLLLTAIGPLLAWRKTSVESLRRNFCGPRWVLLQSASS